MSSGGCPLTVIWPSKIIHPWFGGGPGRVADGVAIDVGVRLGVTVAVSVGVVAGTGMRAKSSITVRLMGKVNGQPKQTSSVSSVMTA